MKIIDLITQNKLSLSFEVFPPKTETSFESVKIATEEIAQAAAQVNIPLTLRKTSRSFTVFRLLHTLPVFPPQKKRCSRR